MRPAMNTERLTAGFTWQPEIGPIPYAIATIANPNASAMPSCPTWSMPPSTAAPQPNSTSASVPMNSASIFLVIQTPT